MYINGIGFINTISQHIIFSIGSIINIWKIKNIEDGTKQVHKLYLKHAFKITHIRADSEVEPLQVDMDHHWISLNCTSKKWNLPYINQFNLIIKERVQYYQSDMFFKRISKLIIAHIFDTDILWLNAFPPSKTGTRFSNTKSLVQLFLGTFMQYKKFFHLHPGKYVQVHQEYEPWNTIHIYQTYG